MHRDDRLELRLREWASEYMGGKYENVGWPSKSPMANLIKYCGQAPTGLNPRRIEINSLADEVEQAVRALESQHHGYTAGRVLRAEYWMPSADASHKLHALRKSGLSVSRSGYFRNLEIARVHVAGWLRIIVVPVA